MKDHKSHMTLAAVGDLHCTRSSSGKLKPLLQQIQNEADVLLLCGDVTDYGLPEEAHMFVKEMSGILKIPIVGVLGNHDFESGKSEEVKEIFINAGIQILDGNAYEINGVGFAGVKGFAGGFGNLELQPWGEVSIKAFVKEAVDESIKLEAALSRIHSANKVVLMHYSPILETVQGEHPEIYPFLGSSRLEEAINRFKATVVFHGHAHHGVPEGKTSSGTPVYNVAMPVLKRYISNEMPFRILTLECEPHGAPT